MALSYGLSLNVSLVFSIQRECIIENYIISVERLKQYMHIPSEAPEIIEGNRPPVNWPTVGKVEINDLQVKSLTVLGNAVKNMGLDLNIHNFLVYTFETDKV